MYAIRWRNLRTNEEQQGVPWGGEAEVQKWCDELNRKYSGLLHHWPVLVVEKPALATR